MKIRELPYGFSTMDTVRGTVIELKRKGAEVLLDDWGDSDGPLRAFVFGASQVGQVMFTLKGYNSSWGNFIGDLDSCAGGGYATHVSSSSATATYAECAKAA